MPSENITFDNIPTTYKVPNIYSEYNTSNAVRSLPVNAQKVALIAQKTDSGSGTVNKPVRCFSEEDAILYGGTGSVAHLATKAMLTANGNVDLDLVPISDATGTDATGLLLFSGVDSTNAGSIEVWVGNVRSEAAVAVGDGPSDVASSVYTAMNNNAQNMPVTLSYDSTKITAVARNYGTLGNNIPISYKMSSQLTDTTATVTQPTGGETDPTIDDALTGIYSGTYNLIFSTLNNSTALGALKTHLNNIDDPTEGRPAVGVFGYTGVQATVETLCGTTLNSGQMTCGYLPYDKTSERGHSLDYEVGAAYCSMIAKETDPARPLNKLILTGIAPNELDQRLSSTEQQSLLENGVTPLTVFPGEQVGIVRAVSTYTTNSSGFSDTALLDITTIRTLNYVRLALETRLSNVFPRAKLSERTPARVRTQVIDVLKQLESLEIIERVDQYIDRVLVERDTVDPNRVNISIPCDVVNGLHIIAQKINLYL